MIILKKEGDFLDHLSDLERKETIGWMAVAEKSLQKVWNNSKDDEIWKKYLADDL